MMDFGPPPPPPPPPPPSHPGQLDQIPLPETYPELSLQARAKMIFDGVLTVPSGKQVECDPLEAMRRKQLYDYYQEMRKMFDPRNPNSSSTTVTDLWNRGAKLFAEHNNSTNVSLPPDTSNPGLVPFMGSSRIDPIGNGFSSTGSTIGSLAPPPGLPPPGLRSTNGILAPPPGLPALGNDAIKRPIGESAQSLKSGGNSDSVSSQLASLTTPGAAPSLVPPRSFSSDSSQLSPSTSGSPSCRIIRAIPEIFRKPPATLTGKKPAAAASPLVMTSSASSPTPSRPAKEVAASTSEEPQNERVKNAHALWTKQKADREKKYAERQEREKNRMSSSSGSRSSSVKSSKDGRKKNEETRKPSTSGPTTSQNSVDRLGKGGQTKDTSRVAVDSKKDQDKEAVADKKKSKRRADNSPTVERVKQRKIKENQSAGVVPQKTNELVDEPKKDKDPVGKKDQTTKGDQTEPMDFTEPKMDEPVVPKTSATAAPTQQRVDNYADLDFDRYEPYPSFEERQAVSDRAEQNTSTVESIEQLSTKEHQSAIVAPQKTDDVVDEARKGKVTLIGESETANVDQTEPMGHSEPAFGEPVVSGTDATVAPTQQRVANYADFNFDHYEQYPSFEQWQAVIERAEQNTSTVESVEHLSPEENQYAYVAPQKADDVVDEPEMDKVPIVEDDQTTKADHTEPMDFTEPAMEEPVVSKSDATPAPTQQRVSNYADFDFDHYEPYPSFEERQAVVERAEQKVSNFASSDTAFDAVPLSLLNDHTQATGQSPTAEPMDCSEQAAGEAISLIPEAADEPAARPAVNNFGTDLKSGVSSMNGAGEIEYDRFGLEEEAPYESFSGRKSAIKPSSAMVSNNTQSDSEDDAASDYSVETEDYPSTSSTRFVPPKVDVKQKNPKLNKDAQSEDDAQSEADQSEPGTSEPAPGPSQKLPRRRGAAKTTSLQFADQPEPGTSDPAPGPSHRIPRRRGAAMTTSPQLAANIPETYGERPRRQAYVDAMNKAVVQRNPSGRRQTTRARLLDRPVDKLDMSQSLSTLGVNIDDDDEPEEIEEPSKILAIYKHPWEKMTAEETSLLEIKLRIMNSSWSYYFARLLKHAKETHGLPTNVASSKLIQELIDEYTDEDSKFMQCDIDLNAIFPDEGNYRLCNDYRKRLTCGVQDLGQEFHKRRNNGGAPQRPPCLYLSGTLLLPIDSTAETVIQRAKKWGSVTQNAVYKTRKTHEAPKPDRNLVKMERDFYRNEFGYTPIDDMTGKDELRIPCPRFVVKSKADLESKDFERICNSASIINVSGILDVLGFDTKLFDVDTITECHPKLKTDGLHQYPQPINKNEYIIETQHLPTSWYNTQKSHPCQLQEYRSYWKKQVQLADDATEKLLNCSSMEEMLDVRADMLKDQLGVIHEDTGCPKEAFQHMFWTKFGTNVDLENEERFELQLQEIEKLPAFLRPRRENENLLTLVDDKILGVNTVQVYIKTPGSRTCAHFENALMASININIGPGTCIWYGVPYEYWGLLADVLNSKKISLHDQNYWPDEEVLLEKNIPVIKFEQHAGDLVHVNTGTFHWVQSEGFCVNVSWNVGQTTFTQLSTSMISYSNNIDLRYQCHVPLVTLAWRIAREKLFMNDPDMVNAVRAILIRSLANNVMFLDVLELAEREVSDAGEIGAVRHNARCTACLSEVFNVQRWFSPVENLANQVPTRRRKKSSNDDDISPGSWVVLCGRCVAQRDHSQGRKEAFTIKKSLQELSAVLDAYKQ